MKGKWKAYSQVIGDKYMYIAGRQLDTSKPLHSGNFESSGEYSENQNKVNELCEILNHQQEGDD